MAISKSDIRTAVNNRTGRSESQSTIDEFLKSIMYDVTLTGPFLRTSTSLSFSSSVNSASVPSDFREVDHVAGLIRREFIDLQNLSTTLTTEGTPRYWAYYDKTIYIWPTPSSNVSYTMFYSQVDDTISTIALTDEFEECLIQGTTWKLFEDKNAIELAAAYKSLYDEQLAKLRDIYTR